MTRLARKRTPSNISIVIIPFMLTLLASMELSSINTLYFKREMVWIALSLILFLSVQIIPLQFWRKSSLVLYMGSIFLLLVVLILPSNGPKRWFYLAGVVIQPSEVAKFAFVIFLSSFFRDTRRRTVKGFFMGGVITAIPFVLVLVEPDLATSIVFVFIFLFLAFIMDISLSPILFVALTPLAMIASFSPFIFLIFILSVIVLLRILRYGMRFNISLLSFLVILGLFTPLLWSKGLKDYQRKRIVAFLAPEKYREETGWQILQAKIAMGSGGISGKGYREGTQKGLNFLPAAHTDFIFSSVGEEFGVVGTLIIISSFSIFILLLLAKAQRLRGSFGELVILGFTAYLIYHFFSNIASNLGYLPVAGIPLPFMSYGGSHLVIEYLFVGIIFKIFYTEGRAQRSLR